MRTFSLGAGADTVVFAGSLTNNGKDTITGFTAGAGGDKLNFKAFSDSLTVGNLNVPTGQAGQAGLALNNNSNNNKIYQTTINDNIALKDYGDGDFDELFATSGTPFTTAITSGGKDLIVVKGNDVTQIYYVHDSNSDSTVANTEVALVAMIDNNGSGVTLTADNFVF